MGKKVLERTRAPSAWGARRSIIAGMSGRSILRLFLPRIVAGFLVGVLYAGARYGSPVSGGLAGACARPASLRSNDSY